MGKQRIEGQPQAVDAIGARQDRRAEERLCTELVAARDLQHRTSLEIGRRGIATSQIVVPAREHPREAGNIVLAVGFLQRAVQELRCAVEIKLDEADGEQLHDFACIIFVRQRAGGCVVFHIAAKGEEFPHRRTGRDRLQQRTVVAEGIGFEQVEVGGGRKRSPARTDKAINGGDHDFGQGQRHALAQGVGSAEHLQPGSGIEPRLGVLVDRRVVSVRDQPVPAAGRYRCRKLLIDPCRITDRLHASNLIARGTHRRLREKPGGIRRRNGDTTGYRRRGNARRSAAIATATPAATGKYCSGQHFRRQQAGTANADV